MIRKSLLLAAGAAFASGAAIAADLPVGDVDDMVMAPAGPQGLLLSAVADVWGGYVWMDPNLTTGNDNPNDTGRVGGQLRVNIPLGNRFSVQLDGAAEGDFDNDYPATNSTQDYEGLVQGGGHLSYRDPNAYLIGVFGGYGHVFVGEGTGTTEKDENGWMFGGEGQVYLGNTTLYGQAGYFDSSANDSETLVDAWFARAQAQHFLTPNSVVVADFIYGAGENNVTPSNDDIDFAGWELKYKRQLMAFPATWHAAYEGHYVAVDKAPGAFGPDEDLYEHIVKFGVSFAWGGGDSMQDLYRRGPALDLPLEPLRAAGYTVDIVD